MPYNDGIPRINCYSLTDFHTFEFCPFRFFVTHHLEKKYEIEEGNYNMALGSLLDETIKLFHKTRSYNQPLQYIKNLITASCKQMIDKVKYQKRPSFYSGIEKFLNDDLCQKAYEIFTAYYETLGRRIKPAIAEVGFCEWVIKSDEGVWKIWGGPDAIEAGDDGTAEVVDYKFREDIEKGKDNMDMDLMPKVYVLLCLDKLAKLGFSKARFVVRFWQDPLDNSFYEEFDLSEVAKFESILKQKIIKILSVSEVSFCNKDFCRACQSDRKSEFIKELKKMGIDTNVVESSNLI
ncbi:PD-(D/E)XK nuclease family protein [Candidatus Daviesbacteria bacterium]|nr:PD-(D/E)XK nuclease family protein [Candidatus Daviesbacteria bacterium]